MKDRKSIVYSRCDGKCGSIFLATYGIAKQFRSAKRTNIRGIAKSNSEVYLHLAAKTLFVLSGIILITSFVFVLIAVPSIVTGNWENVFFVPRETHWKITVGGLFTMLLGMIFYIIAFLLSKK